MRGMCSCGHGHVTATAMASSSSLQLRPTRLCSFTPSLLLPSSRILQPTRCSWSRISFATPREETSIYRGALEQHQQQENGNGNGAAAAAPRTNGAINGNSRRQEEPLVEEFFFTQDYLDSLDYDSVGRSNKSSNGISTRVGRRKIWVKLDSKLALTTANAAVKVQRKLLPASIAEVLPLKPETGFKYYAQLYASLLKAGRIKDCLTLLGEVDKVGKLAAMKVNHSRFYEACKTKGSVEDAFNFLKLMRPYSTLQHYTMLLSVCCHAKDIDGALRVLNLLENSGLKADCMFYTTLISACSKAGKVDLLFQIYHEMELRKIDANVHTFGAMIDGCARAGQLPKAFGAYGIMMSKNVKPDRVIFNTLINACSRAGAVQRAFDVLTDMKSEATPVKPDHVTYGALISACARKGEVEKALEVYQSMRESQTIGSPECYTAVVHACSQKGDLAYALTVLDDMKKDGVKPDQVFFSALVDVAGHSKNIDKAFSILDSMKKEGIKPKAIVYSSLMGVCSNLGKWEKALELYERIRASGIQLTVSTFNALMTALCEAKQFDQTYRVLQDMKARGIKPNQISYSILLKACEKEGRADMALDLFMSARTEGIKPNVTICDSITSLCLQQIISSAPAPQVSLTMIPAADLINIAARDQWLTWALAIYRQTIEAGAVPTIESLSSLLGCLRKPEVSRNDPPSFEDTFNHQYPTGFAQPQPTPVASTAFDGFGIYDPRALSLFEEASALNIAPTFKYATVEPIIINAEFMPVHAAEVCLLTVLKGLTQRHAAGARVPAVIIKTHPVKKEIYRPKGGLISMTVADKTGQAIGALIRRLKLKAQGYVSTGEVRLTVIELLKWLNPKPTATNPTIPLKNPFAFPGTPQSLLAKTIADQQRAIRLGTSAPPMRTIDMLADMDTRQGHFQQPDDYDYSYDIPPTRTYRKPSNSSY